MTTVLVVDDERKMRRVLQMLLERMGCESLAAESLEEAIAHLERQHVDLVLTDLRMPGGSGLELLARVREADAELPVIVLTAYGTVETAVEAMKRGAVDYVLKPFDLEALEVVIRRALDLRRYRTENRYLREQVEPTASFESLVGVSAVMQDVYDVIQRVAPTKTSVLVTGETGTGKELVAHAIHNLSPRRDHVFVAINCAAIPSELLESELFGHTRGAFTGADRERIGRFELADGGTIFLDEIGDMAYPLQAKLLRVLQEGSIERIGSNKRIGVDARVVSSTHRDLAAAIRDERFREDLYYRLNVVHVAVPPLRERREDIVPLARHFLAAFARDLGRPALALGAEAARLLEQYDWPGNVRELQNLMERTVVLCDGLAVDPAFFRRLLATEVPEPAPETLDLETAVGETERKLILRALNVAGDNKVQAAGLLGVSERTLWYKLKKYGL
jgi:two-component system response regulator AtoC